LLKRNDKVYTQIVKDVSAKTLKQVIEQNIDKTSSNAWRSYDGVVDWGYKHHYRLHHGNNEFVQVGNNTNHINGNRILLGLCKK
jgi:hypothetical protein